MRFTVFFFNDTATTEIYTLSLHDALPISGVRLVAVRVLVGREQRGLDRLEDRLERDVLVALDGAQRGDVDVHPARSEEHTSELQSRQYLVCRLLLEKKKNKAMLPPT